MNDNNGATKAVFTALGSKLAAHRMLCRISQAELARRTGISQPNISRIENGQYNPTVGTLKKLADGLGRELKIDFC